MTEHRDVIDRIDSLVNRKRVFVAGARTVSSGRHAAEDEDIPMLTEVVDITEVSSDAPTRAAHPPIEPLLDAVTLDFAYQLQQRFALELPTLIDEATNKLKIELQQNMHRITDQCLREFVARRQQLPLPLPDADPSGE
jgi:hypothetical protein